jgi:hypothetical protein
MAKAPLPMAPDEIDPWEVSLYEKWKLTDQLLPWTDFRAKALTAKNAVASTNPLGSDEILAYMKAAGLPLTRENYLALAWPDAPEEWTQELENQLPLEFQQPLAEPSPDQ